jgi:hypothetical protein
MLLRGNDECVDHDERVDASHDEATAWHQRHVAMNKIGYVSMGNRSDLLFVFACLCVSSSALFFRFMWSPAFAQLTAPGHSWTRRTFASDR